MPVADERTDGTEFIGPLSALPGSPKKTPSDERWHGDKHFHIKNYILEMTPSQGKMRLKSALQKLNLLMAKVI